MPVIPSGPSLNVTFQIKISSMIIIIISVTSSIKLSITKQYIITTIAILVDVNCKGSQAQDRQRKPGTVPDTRGGLRCGGHHHSVACHGLGGERFSWVNMPHTGLLPRGDDLEGSCCESFLDH